MELSKEPEVVEVAMTCVEEVSEEVSIEKHEVETVAAPMVEPEIVYLTGYLITDVNVRPDPTIECEPYTVYSAGTEIRYREFNDDWVEITYEGETAYIYSRYVADELYLMSHLLMGEAGNCDDTTQLWVGSVALNRIKSKHFSDSLYGVIYQKGQYACTWDGNFNKQPTEQCIKNAAYLLENGSVLPDNVVWQAGFMQGDGIYSERDGLKFCFSNF